ncbi:energy transducer TonB [Sphingomonas sp. RS6]
MTSVMADPACPGDEPATRRAAPRRAPARGLRWRGAAAALLAEGLLAWLLVIGLASHRARPVEPDPAIIAFAVPPVPDPPRAPVAPRQAAPEREGAAAPPNRVSRATEIAAPPPLVALPPPPIVAAPKAATGDDASSGAAPVAGPGTGAGGMGEGTGSGGRGDGPGGGGGMPLRLIAGHIDGSDYPRAALRAGASGTVGLRFIVGVKGRVTHCTVTRSSGNAALDETTCRLIVKRFRYRPSLDAAGRPYADTVTGEQVWELWDRPAAP